MIGEEDEEREMRVFVSLRPDRETGGYRMLEKVMSVRTTREQLLEDAYEELKHFRDKYKELREVAAVFEATDEVLVSK